MNKTELKQAIREIDAQMALLNRRRAGFEQVLATFETDDGKVVERKRRAPHRPRVARSTRKRQILDHLRKHPDRDWTYQDLAMDADLPESTTRTCFLELVEEEKVTVTNDAVKNGGTPTIKHKPVTVRPGEEVKQ